VVINQQQSRGEDDDDQDDEMVDDGFGYQQLPQDADGPELDSGDNETEVVDHERSQPGRTDPIEYQTNEDNSIPEGTEREQMDIFDVSSIPVNTNSDAQIKCSLLRMSCPRSNCQRQVSPMTCQSFSKL
jgi:hypothetical protein